MNHHRWKQWIHLYLYDELNDVEKRLLQEHLDGCDICKTELEQLLRFQETITDHHSPLVNEQLLREARRQLHHKLHAPVDKISVRDRVLFFLRSFGQSFYRPVFVAPFSLILGLIFSYGVFHSPSGVVNKQESQRQSLFLAGETKIANVRFLNTENVNGEVDFTFEAVRPVHMKGSIEDGQIQKVLTYAIMNEDNPGIRLRSVTAVAGQKSADREVKNALMTALRSDDNTGVRKESLQALRNFPFDDEIKKVLLYVLNHDKNPGLRIAAINLLDSLRNSNLIPNKEMLDVFKNAMQTDGNNYIRLRAKAAVEEIKQ